MSTYAQPEATAPLSHKTVFHVVYALYALSAISGITAVVGLVIAYVKADDVRGTWLASHVRWLVRTFWFGLLWAVLAWPLLFILVGIPMYIALWIWLVYRVVKGWLRLNDNRPMYA